MWHVFFLAEAENSGRPKQIMQSTLQPFIAWGVYISTYIPPAKTGQITKPNISKVGTYAPPQRGVP